jgi:LmbE family N-acetylglucosaminyl deacetylase
MLELRLPAVARRPLRLLCLGAHCDDIEIGCGGTLLRLLAEPGRCEVTWVVFSSTALRERELRSSARTFLRRALRTRLVTHQFRDSFFPGEYVRIKESFDALKRAPVPDLIFTHHRADLHQDHRLIGELTWNAFRQHLILEYEIPKYDGGLTTPNVYVSLSRSQAGAKVSALLRSYPSQRTKPWFSAETFRALMHLRGVEAGAGGPAEGFHAAKLALG